jgi:hypothetical protein
LVIDVAAIKLRYEALSPMLDERGRRRFAAAEALAAGWGGIAAVCEATGIARSTIDYGLRELRGQAPDSALGGIRRKGAGRKPLTETDPTLLSDLEDLVDPATRGDPMSPLKWTSKSLRNLASALCAMGHRVGYDVVGTLLKRLGYSLQANRKTIEGAGHVDRDAQFQHIAETVKAAIAADQPAISVDTKKKELVGDFKNGGREYRPAGSPGYVRVHDFVDPKLGRAAPYGIYDIADDKGWVSVGIDHDTAAFAVNAIRSWWMTMGRDRYPRPYLDGHRRWRGKQRRARPPLEDRTAKACRRTGPDHRRPALAARHQQMEQDRTEPLLVHLAQLEGATARRLSHHCRTDRRDHLDRWPHRSLRTGRKPLSHRDQNLRRRNGRDQYRPPHLSRRMELYNQPKTAKNGAVLSTLP